MSIFDPKQTGSEAEPNADRKRADAPLPTRFGRSRRRFEQRFQPSSGPADTPREPRAAADDERLFADDGGL